MATASSRPKTLNFITGNANKLAEVTAILGDVVALQSKSLDLVEIQGTSDEIALDKCRRAAVVVSHEVIHPAWMASFSTWNGVTRMRTSAV
jgi:inosine/xanthosine triphosphate pyrophosphatase family protein